MNIKDKRTSDLEKSSFTETTPKPVQAEARTGDQTPVKCKGIKCGGELPDEKVDPLYQMLKPLHNLPRGKNTWDPQFIKKRWFWPVSAVVIIILFYIYPYIWDFFSTN
ncbi:hypothetical protein [Desulfonatronovibrio magnus]|uniref:hypothetical protein n=1 Tax=Desulfonatronovibrio magnus TaxID=698827 RepID=UPI0005EB7260|nr:hypothetical protein [Desulfonatronovibrio magnus]RQD60258.1 MAG: hypothetical protein D5R98_07125 [Desulfonatronovibrio sp. MSAO_Bac4]